MSRKAAKQDITTIEMNDGALAEASTALNTLGVVQRQAADNALALATEFAYQGELTEAALEDEIRLYQRRSAEACLELGKRLLLLKELTPHGQFMSRVEALGIQDRMARRFMTAALKFSKSDFKSVLNAAGSQTKLLELTMLDDDEITVLSDGGSVRGVELDTIRSMGVTQLRQALRERDEKIAAKDRVAENTSAKILELQEAIERPYKPKPNALAKTQEEASALNALSESINGAEVEFARLAVIVADLSENEREPLRERATQAVQYLVLRMREIVQDNNLSISIDEETLGGRPVWLDESL